MEILEQLSALRKVRQNLSDAKDAIGRIEREVQLLYVELSQRAPNPSDINSPKHEGRE